MEEYSTNKQTINAYPNYKKLKKKKLTEYLYNCLCSEFRPDVKTFKEYI